MKNFNLEKFKEYVNTYEKQTGHKDYSKETVIDDFVYGIGLCMDEEKYKHAGGYAKFKEKLLDYFLAKRNISRNNELTTSERSIIFKIIHPGAWADVFIHHSFPEGETYDSIMNEFNIPTHKEMSIKQSVEKKFD